MTVEELPHIEGRVLNVPRQEKTVQIKATGVFSINGDGGAQSYASESDYSGYDGFTMSFGMDKCHNNISPCVASYIWQRTA